MQDIKFSRQTHALGRNGNIKASGLTIANALGNTMISPITSKNKIGRCRIYIPDESIPDVIKALSEYAPKPEPQYFLLGSIACKNFLDMDFDEFIQDIEETGLAGETFEWDGSNVVDLLSKIDDWGSYSFLSKTEYDKINEL